MNIFTSVNHVRLETVTPRGSLPKHFWDALAKLGTELEELGIGDGG